MSIARLATAVALVLSGAVHASNTFNLATSTCSGSLVSSDTDGFSLACTGDLVLSNGDIASDTFISLSATGSLNLDNITLSAPTITLTSNGPLGWGEGNAVKPLNGRDSSLSVIGAIREGSIPISGGGSISVSAGRDISLGNSWVITPVSGMVPEPSGSLLLVAGLAAAATLTRRDQETTE